MGSCLIWLIPIDTFFVYRSVCYVTVSVVISMNSAFGF